MNLISTVRERSSVVEHVLHTDGVTGSIPVVRTILRTTRVDFGAGEALRPTNNREEPYI